MSANPFNVLFLCTGNSARSIMAEALLNGMGRGRFRAYSAGSQPARHVHPLALELIKASGLPADGLRSKSWEQFARLGAPEMDFVVSVCANAGGETCPVWPGRPANARWGIDDPAAVSGGEAARRKAFLRAFNELHGRLLIFLSPPLSRLGRHALQSRLDEIGAIGAGQHSATELADRIAAASWSPRPGARRHLQADGKTPIPVR